MLRWVVVVVLLGWGASLGRGSASAQDAADREGRTLFEAARMAFEDGRFDEALDLFERAYARSARPALFYNIGLAADRAGDEERALEAYERYVAEVPESPQLRMVAGRIAVIRRAQAADREPVEPTPPDVEQPDQDAPERPRRVWSYVTMGAALGLGAAATGVWLRANNRFDSLRDRCPPECSNDDADELDRKVRWTNGLMVGALALGVGSVLAFIFEGRAVQPDAAIDTESATLGVRGAF